MTGVSIPRLQRQELQRCGVHAVNNLLQDHRMFSVDDFESIADSLEAPSVLSSIFGTNHKASCRRGNYDLNVIQVALHNSNYDSSWIRPTEISETLFQQQSSNTRLVGYLLNRQEISCCGLWKSNHWYCLTHFQEKWYIVDSKEAMPELVSPAQAASHLDTLLDNGGHALAVSHSAQGSTSSSAAAAAATPQDT